MTPLKAIEFAARVKVGSIIKANNLLLRVDKINKDSFEGQSIYKEKERGKTYLSFETLLNPHYTRDIEIIES